MQIISVSGQKGVGKDTIIDLLLGYCEKDFPGIVKRAIPITDRPLREKEVEGRDIHTVSKEEFTTLRNDSKIIFPKDTPECRNGILPAELEKSPIVVLNILDEYVIKLRGLVEETKGKTYNVFLFTESNVAKSRIVGREAPLFEGMLEHTFELSPGMSVEQAREKFNLVVENKEGQKEQTAQEVYKGVKPFIEQYWKNS